jgi:hypothetical protein
MSYTIKLSNGRTLAVIANQTIDEVSSSLTLIGKNVNDYGEYFNNNLISITENFAGPRAPRSPLAGQTWFDTADSRLKVYAAGTFRPVGSPVVSNITPLNPITGDLWVDTTTGVLKWYNGEEFIPAAKQYADQTGKEGWVIETISDIASEDYQISVFYSEGRRLAVMTNQEIDLNPGTFSYFNTSTIRPGLTINSALGLKVYGTATSAESVAGFDPSNILVTDQDQILTGSLEISNNNGISVGTETNIAIYVDRDQPESIAVIAGMINGETLQIRYNGESTGTNAVAVHIDSENNKIGILTDDPEADVDINGDVQIRGSLVVKGNQTSLEVSVLTVEDKSIELGTGQTTATNANVDGGGIILKGAVDHTFLYNEILDAWQSSLNIDLLNNTDSYKITGATVLESDPDRPGFYRLGDLVTAGRGFVNLPVLSVLTVTDVVLQGNTITTTPDPLTNLNITPSSGIISLGSSAKIVGMEQTLDTDPDDTAVTKKYFEDKISLSLGGFVGRKPYTLSLDITDFNDLDDEIIAYLDRTLPVDGFGDPYYAQPDGARCSVVCTKYEATTATYFLNNLNTSTVRRLFNLVTGIDYTATSTTTSFINTVSSTSTLLVTDFELAGSVTIATPMPKITRTVRLYAVVGGFWTFIEEVDTLYLTSNTVGNLSTGSRTLTVSKDATESAEAFSTYGDIFDSGVEVIVRETETQADYLEGTITSYADSLLTVNLTQSTNALSTATYSSWIIRRKQS